MEQEFIQNIASLQNAVATDAFIRNIKYHRLPDGSLDIDGNLKLWDEGMKPFIKTYLWDEGAPGFSKEKDPKQEQPYLVFVPADTNSNTDSSKAADTILIAHGGGFTWRTGCEGPNIAWYFHQAGYNTAILSYRLAPAYNRFDDIADMQRAIRLLRSKRKEWNLGAKIIIMGFSAGGMICGNCATHFDLGNSESSDPIERFSSKPDAAVICYGAFSTITNVHPFGMPDKGLDYGKTKAEQMYLAPEKNVTVDTPPMFIWQTMSDDGRLGMNLARALQEAGVPYELHIFTNGMHGLGLADGHNDLASSLPHVAHWAKLCDEWLQGLDDYQRPE